MFSNYNKLIPGFIGDDQADIYLDLDLFWLDFMSPSQSLFSASVIFNINWQDDRLKWDLSQLGSQDNNLEHDEFDYGRVPT